MENFLLKIEEELRFTGINNVFVFSHRKHDGDAKGAVLALVSYFKNKGFNSKYIIANEDYLLLDIFEKVEITNEITSKFIAICVDTSTNAIVENNMYLQAEKSFKIDHHNGEEFCHYNFIDTSASSTCEVISSIMLDDDISSEIANYLITGIFTDTGILQYNTNVNTYLQIAKLIQKGAKHNFITSKLNEVSSKRKRLEGLVYTHHKFFTKDLVGSIIYDPKKFEPLSIARTVNSLTNLNAKVFFCIAKSNASNEIFVEVRSSSNTNIDVSNIAKKYGGGGLIHASGFTLTDVNTINTVIEELKKLIKA